ncbi:MAG: sigma-70 family RNA polymerase sigma factor [Leptospiraceae bacterium]|nr:sigma-70 family RNA polymerase sigma factor [Leptospiraceae bacterium]
MKDQEFERLVEEATDMIYSLGMRLFRNNQEDALDFVQDAFLRAYDRWESFEGRSKRSTWLYSLALNLGLNRLSKQKRMPAFAAEPGILDETVAGPDTPETIVTEMLEREEVEEMLQKALEELSEQYRLPIILLYYEKMSYKDMSEQLKTSEGTLKSLVYRGKMQLRDKLKEYSESRA